MKKISILGSTGSIGTQTIDVARKINAKIVALTTNKNIDLLEEQIKEFNPQVVAVYDENSAEILQKRLPNIKIFKGMQGLIEAAIVNSADIVVTAIVGMVGLIPTIKAIEHGKDIALANKETLVCAGEIVMKKAREKGVSIFPVDSEHSAIFQCLQGQAPLKKIILTASGGPFFGRTDLSNITKEQALKHPNWTMGSKITIDSATLMNKGLEFIEAMWLYDTNNIEVVVHPQSIIHSLVEFEDNSVLAQMGVPDMKLPIQYAITYPKRYECDIKSLDLIKNSGLTFFSPDINTFKCLALAMKICNIKGNSGAILNAANEVAVELFLQDKIKFNDIANLVELALEKVPFIKNITLEDIIKSDELARKLVYKSIKE